MRTKKVEEKIHMLKSYAGMTHKLTDNQGRSKLDQAIETVLNYISELEKENMNLLTRLRADSLIDRDNYWKDKIRDKIKELENENDVECIEFNLDVIEVLKELLEGE